MKTITLPRGTGNGNGNGHVAGSERFTLSRTFTEMSKTVVSSVVSTPLRLIDVLEHTEDAIFTIRETEFHGVTAGNVSVQHIRLYRHELERLHTVVGAALGKRPAPQERSA